MESFRNYVGWLYHGDCVDFVWDLDLWKIAHDLGSTDLQNTLVNGCQTWKFDHHFLWLLNDLRVRGWTDSTLWTYMKRKVAYEIIRRGLITVLDIAEGKHETIKDGESALKDMEKVALLTALSDDLIDSRATSFLQDPAEHKGYK
jgi:hypothetical protein